MPLYVLGVHISVNYWEMFQLNMESVIAKAKATLDQWRNRRLTGKVLVVNSLVESLFVYRFSVLPVVCMETLTEMQNHIWKFVWSDKRAKINFDQLKQPKNQGGL